MAVRAGTCSRARSGPGTPGPACRQQRWSNTPRQTRAGESACQTHQSDSSRMQRRAHRRTGRAACAGASECVRVRAASSPVRWFRGVPSAAVLSKHALGHDVRHAPDLRDDKPPQQRAGPRIRAGSADHARGSSCGHSHEHELRIGARWHCADRRDEGRSTRRLHRAAGQEEGARQKDVAAASMDTTPTC